MEMDLFLRLACVDVGNFLMLHSMFFISSILALFLSWTGRKQLSPNCIRCWTLFGMELEDKLRNHFSLKEEIEGGNWYPKKDEGCKYIFPEECSSC